MRLIGHLEESSQAAAFGDFLYLEGIENDVEREDDGAYSVWVHDEEAFEKAGVHLENFRKDPNRVEFKGLEAKANQLRRQRQEETADQGFASQRREAGSSLTAAAAESEYRLGRATRFLITTSIFVFLARSFDLHEFFKTGLHIRSFDILANGMIEWMPNGLPEVRKGEIWRLITPIFIHYDVFHILFNMWLLAYLGSQIERVGGPWFLALMVCLIAVLSNIAQFAFISPGFGGMSGVVYGIFGYIWFHTKLNPESEYEISQTNLYILIGWFFLCLLPGSGVANMVHAIGLLIGVVWGFLSCRLTIHSNRQA